MFSTQFHSGKPMFNPIKIFLTRICFSQYITYSSLNFTCFALLIPPPQIWWQTSVQAWSTLFDLMLFWIASKRIFLRNQDNLCCELIPNNAEFTFMVMHSEKEFRGRTRSVMAKVLDCDPEVREFKLQSHFYAHSRTDTLKKCMNPLYSSFNSVKTKWINEHWKRNEFACVPVFNLFFFFTCTWVAPSYSSLAKISSWKLAQYSVLISIVVSTQVRRKLYFQSALHDLWLIFEICS